MHFEGCLRRVVFGTARGSPANNPGGRSRCRRGPSTHMPSAQHVSSVNVKFFEFTRARTRPATRRSPRAPAQSRLKGPCGVDDMYGAVDAKRRGQGTPSWSLCVGSARDSCSRFAPEGPAGPGSAPAYATFCRGQGPSTRAARNGPLRREGAAETTIRVPGPRNAFLQKLCICAKWRRRST